MHFLILFGLLSFQPKTICDEDITEIRILPERQVEIQTSKGARYAFSKSLPEDEIFSWVKNSKLVNDPVCFQTGKDGEITAYWISFVGKLNQILDQALIAPNSFLVETP